MPEMKWNEKQVAESKKTYTQAEDLHNRAWEVANEGQVRTAMTRLDKILFPILNKYFPFNSVLDLGCGSAVFFSSYISIGSLNVRKMGIDLCFAAIEKNRKEFPDCEFVFGDILDSCKQIESNKFNLVTAFGVIQHIPDRQKRLDIYREMARISNKYICISAYGGDNKDKFFKSSKTGRRLFAVTQTKDAFLKDWIDVGNLKVIEYEPVKKSHLVLLEVM